MSNSSVTSGPPQSGLIVSSGSLFVYSGGTIIGTQIEQGGTATLFLGGVASNTSVTSGGVEVISSGGASVATTLADDASDTVLFGATATSTMVMGSASESVFSGGVTNSAVVGSGGMEIISAGGTASATSLQGGDFLVHGTAIGGVLLTGSMTVSSGGVESGTVVSARLLTSGYYATYSGGELFVLSGAAADNTIISGAGPAFIDMVVSAGGTIDTLTVDGGMVLLSGGSAREITLAGGVTSNVPAAGEMNVYSDGMAIDITVEARGILAVEANGQASTIIVASGGAENVFAGTASGTVISSGGQQDIAGGLALETTIEGGGEQSFGGNGTARDTILLNGATQIFYGGGTAVNTAIYAGGTIDLFDREFSAAATANVDLNDLLTISAGGTTFTEQLYGDYTGATFPVSEDTGSGTKVVVMGNVAISGAPCFCKGTFIRSERGLCAVEKLMVGDRVITASGGSRPVIWLGHRAIATARHSSPDLIWPVRVRTGAFGAGQPMRDLFLSPDHAVLVDEVLIPIKHLSNGRSITQVVAEYVEYWHVELDRHDVILAEGLPCESYLDTGNRIAFANGHSVVSLHPDFGARSWDNACAKLVEDGPVLAAVKRRLFELASIELRQPPFALRVLVDQHEIAPAIAAPGVWRFALPPSTRALHLLSAPWIPAEHYAASLDRRKLGVRLFGVTIDGTAMSLGDDALFIGFYAPEDTAEGSCRWTNGDARLVLPIGATSVTLEIGDTIASSDRGHAAASEAGYGKVAAR